MRIAIMQPYLFPYIGYFQLVNAVEKFIAYDDVTFIKQGWINRNNILLNGKPFLFTVPLVNVSSHTLIRDTQICEKVNWRPKFLKTIEQAYKKAPQYSSAFPLIQEVVCNGPQEIVGLAVKSLNLISSYIGIDTEIKESAIDYNNQHLHAQERVLDICRQEKASEYVNPIGGIELYSKETFKGEGIDLYFIKSNEVQYPQFNDHFVSRLSIIDVLMFNTPDQIAGMLNQFELV